MSRVPQTVDLRKMFLGLQQQMIAALQCERDVLHHAPTQGSATELQWLNMLDGYLPKRYCVESAFVLDSNGNASEQIDIVIFDRQYSPFLFNQDGAKYVPAESVYAVLEVKPELNANYVKYAGEKAASVRRLQRTSARIPHAGGIFPAKTPPRILAGIVALESGWKPPFGPPFESALTSLLTDEELDIGCALRHGAFSIENDSQGRRPIQTGQSSTALMLFFLRLMSQLQSVGTVAAVDFDAYSRVL